MLKQGRGWRLGWRADAPVYKGLVGAEDWALELTAEEMRDFCRLLRDIHQTVADISKHLMPEEAVVCEVESELLWLGAEGYPDNYSLRIILSQPRRGEGTWPPYAITELLQASQSLELF
ncbi:MAG: DUF1818 family protein [Geminocystis sp.]|nr:DUF1818 family protein [Geminocystis sp.]HIK38117.1 DUF1818 family protein [Geminocystis sp. M7585_C2015_104]MCS7148319.1 DUF1818 family protein [Geminocystis sp.]MCX8077733.1 DUF1818 family protein [Geminocystis sp.]MDW8116625.1 DUF1818 family protein [Geminocystis sp.]